jgi:nucleotide-binding universal stress UspA family protein
VADELQAAAAAVQAQLLGVGRVGRLAGRMGSTPLRLLAHTPVPLLIAPLRPGERPLPLTLLETASPAADRAWALALRLATALPAPPAPEPALQIVATDAAAPAARARLEDALRRGISATLQVAPAAGLLPLLQRAAGPVLLPADALRGSPLSADSLPATTVLVIP